MRGRKICIFLVVVIIIAGMATAVSFRKSIPPIIDVSDDALAEYRVSMLQNIYEIAPPPEAKGLIEASDVVVRVRPTGRREAHRLEVLSQVVIDSIFKNDTALTPGETIFVYEPVSIIRLPEERRISIYGNRNLMQLNRSYLLCLKFFRQPNGYEYAERETKTYVFTDQYNSLFSFQPESEVYILPSGAKEFPTFSEVQRHDILSGSQQDIDDYLTLRTEIFANIFS